MKCNLIMALKKRTIAKHSKRKCQFKLNYKNFMLLKQHKKKVNIVRAWLIRRLLLFLSVP